jgi:tetratricopeptide (TPR) repeat protein
VAATINYNKKNYQVAADHYTELEQVAVQKLNVLEAQIGLMRCHYFLGNKDLAATFADKVVLNANTPDDIKTTGFLWRGRIRMDKNDDAGATLDFKEVMKKGGGNAAEAKYHIAYMYYRSGQYDKAEEELFQHIEKYSAFAEWKYKAFLLLADVYVGMKDYFQTRTTLDQILERVQEQWVRDEATRKLAELDALENPDQGGSRSIEEEINLVPEQQN